MEHAQTIAIATDLLADGRADDVVKMVDPLLEPVNAPAASTGQLLLRTLKAQIEIAHRDRPEEALNLLPTVPQVQDVCTCVRAEVSLWRGWAHTRVARSPGTATRAVNMLDHARELFASIHDPRGRCWALLGEAHGYFQLDEYGLMRETLADVEELVTNLHDRLAERWLHELSIPALRFEGRYDAAEEHLLALRALGRDWNDRRIRGRATAYEAALRFDLGDSPSEIASTADRAESLLQRVDAGAQYPLLAAYHAHAGALLRMGRWDDAEDTLNEAETRIHDAPGDLAYLQTLRIEIALRRDNGRRAKSLLDDVLQYVEEIPHGVHRAHLALIRGEVLARQNHLEEAYVWMARAHRNARETGHRGNQLKSLLTMARTAAARSDLETARSHLRDADEFDSYYSVLPFAVRRFAAEGTIAQTADQVSDATDAYRHALAAASMIGDRHRTASLQLALAQLEDDDRAHALASAARDTFADIEASDEVEVASALVDGTNPSDETVSSVPHPVSISGDAELGATLTRASLSVPLVANTWLQLASDLLPGRWMGIYRMSADGIASLLNEHGRRPKSIQSATGAMVDAESESVEWLQLRSEYPTLSLGVEVDPSNDEEWNDARTKIQAWLPLLRLALERALLHQRQARSAWTQNDRRAIPVDGFISESKVMENVVDQLQEIRVTRGPVLVTGESGTGKPLLARAIHSLSARSDGPFNRVACANMQQEPLEERLFGSVDGDGNVSTGAIQDTDGGTLVLQNVEALPEAAQESLLHFLDTGEVISTGEADATPVDVRIIATTEGTLDEVTAEHVRPALREKLSVLSLHMPPLRERRADIPLLVRHYLDTLRSEKLREAGKAPVTQPAMEALLQYDWPGNVRQLRNELERALVHVENEPVQTIDRNVLLDQIVESAQSAKESPAVDPVDAILHPDRSLDDILSRTEASAIERVLQACEGQVTASAEVLGLSRQGLYKKMKRLGIDASDFQPDSQPATASS